MGIQIFTEVGKSMSEGLKISMVNIGLASVLFNHVIGYPFNKPGAIFIKYLNKKQKKKSKVLQFHM